jgi:AcrR family transcriptional regulator
VARLVAERADLLAPLAELFREHGYEGTSLARITLRTGLGKGSLYHFFPGGKEEMAAAVLDEIGAWFEAEVYRPLREAPDAAAAIEAMFAAVDAYFRSGRRVCLVGALALADTRDRFAAAIHGYFADWTTALAGALERAGHAGAPALAEEVVAGIHGALLLARALGEPAAFGRALARLRARTAIAR